MRKHKHFFNPPFQIGNDLVIRGIGVEELMPPCRVYRPNGTEDWLLMVFHDQVLLGKYGTLPPPILMIWEPYHLHDYGNPSHPWNHSWIHCEGSIIRQWTQDLSLPLNVPIPLLHGDEFLIKGLDEIEEELVQFTTIQPVIVKDLLEILFWRIQRCLDPHQNLRTSGKPIPESLLRAKHYLETHYHNSIHLHDLAHLAHLSVPRFCVLFRQYFGMSPNAYKIQLRMEEAKYLLLNQQVRIKEVAEQVGISDPYYFSRLFRAYCGISPKQWQKSTPSRFFSRTDSFPSLYQ